MAITSASVEANGWVLRVTHNAGSGSFASYTLDPNGTPALTLATLIAGFVQSAGTVIAATSGRRLIATKTLRKPVSATNAGVRAAKAIDETDNGDGTITVRIALSQHVYAGDTALVLTALAGWRTAASAQSIAVTNNSTIVAPQPIVRWADVPYQLQPGSFDLEVVAVSHHPNALAPVAGVKFTVTDGTTIKSFWTTGLATSTRYQAGGTGLPLRVYKVTVDPATATALTKGLLRCDYKVFPWIGQARVSDYVDTNLTSVASSNATPSMTGLGTAALTDAAQAPFVVAYNPGNAWITPRYIDIDETNGASPTSSSDGTNIALITIGTDPNAGGMGPAKNINAAMIAVWAANITVAAANGQAAITRSSDGVHFRIRKANIATGCTGILTTGGTVAVTSGSTTGATWTIIEGDPTDTNPRANCIWRAGGYALTRATRTRFTRLRLEANASNIYGTTNVWIDDADLTAQSGQSAATQAPIVSSNVAYLTNMAWFGHGTGPTLNGANFKPVFSRNISSDRGFGAPLVANCTHLLASPWFGVIAIPGVGSNSAPTNLPGMSLDRIVIGNDLRSSSVGFNHSFLANASAPASLTLGSTYNVAARHAVINNVFEIVGSSGSVWSSVGENYPSVATQNIIEGNTGTGDRLNSFYNDLNYTNSPSTTYNTLNDTADSIALVNRVANNVVTKMASKHDFYADGFVKTQRNNAGDPRNHGYRPQAVSAWSSHYGVGYEGNVDLQPESVSDAEFYWEFPGIGSLQIAAAGLEPTTSPFTLDRSGTNVGAGQMPWLLPWNSTNNGGGNYRPLTTGTGAYLVARAQSANVDRDQAGVLRTVPFTSGALQSALITLAPASTRHGTTATVGHVGWSAMLRPLGTRSAMRSTSGHLDWSAMLASAPARMATRARPTMVAWAASLVPRSSALATRVRTTTVAWIGVLLPQGSKLPTRAASTFATVRSVVSLAPANTRHAVHDVTRPIVLPGAPTPPERTLTVTGDFRVTLVDAD